MSTWRRMDDTIEPVKDVHGLRLSGYRRIAEDTVWTVLQPVVMLASAGRTDLPRVWLLLAVSLGCLLIGGLVVVKVSPEVINRRGEKPQGIRWWDKLFLLAYGSVALSLPVVAGLDVGRVNGSSLGGCVAAFGVGMYVGGAALFAWAMATNPHFEMTVRIQTERGHRVVAAGPYAIIRHPGYVGGALLGVSVPLIVGSVHSLIPACLLVLLYLIRAELEDRTLHRELPGYKAYAEKVRYRMLPFAW